MSYELGSKFKFVFKGNMGYLTLLIIFKSLICTGWVHLLAAEAEK